jgi:hypothetical protein
MKMLSVAALALTIQDPQSLADLAIHNTRTQKSYETSFTARLAAREGAFDYKGRSVWVSPDVLYIEVTGSGKCDQKIVRAGEKDVWMYHSASGQWPSAVEFGNDGAGRGIQNPDEVLAVLATNTATARTVAQGVVEVTFNGNDLARIMKGVAINPGGSSAKVVLTLDAENRIAKFSCDATLVDPAGAKLRYTSEVTLIRYNGATEIAFTDEKNRPIPLPSDIRDRIEAVRKGIK